jgi:aquaporin Z
MTDQTMTRRLGAEFLGTYILVLAGCGAAVLAAKSLVSTSGDTGQATGSYNLGIGFVGVSMAFGLTVLAGVYAFGHISGGHFNPAVTIGLATSKRFAWKDAVPYIATQVVAAFAASATLWVIAINQKGATKDILAQGGLASNGFGDHSPGLYTMFAALVVEVVFTAIVLLVILGVTDRRAPKGFAALAIGGALMLVHLVTIPVTNASVNPARSTGPALVELFAGESWPMAQLWLFWVAPIIGALLAAAIYNFVGRDAPEELVEDTLVNAD